MPYILEVIIKAVVGLAVGYGALLGLTYAFQDRLLYFPHGGAPGVTPADVGIDYETVRLTTTDGETLHGWWVPALAQSAAPDTARGADAGVSRETSPGPPVEQTILFLHGNAGNIGGRVGLVQQLHQTGRNVLIVDYRGFGASTGSPSEEGLYRDAAAMWKHLTETRGIPPGKIIVHGRSLGGGPATWLAARHQPGALVLESTYTSVPDVAAEQYPIFPARQLVRAQFDNLSRMDRIDAPVLVIHSPDDNVIPYEHGRRLFAAAGEPKQFLQLSGSHAENFQTSARRYVRGLETFLDTHIGQSALSTP